MVNVQSRSTAFRLVATVTTGVALAVGGAGLAEAKTGAATTTVNIRSGPGTSHTIKATLVRGQRISVASKSGAWYKVDFAGSRAYVASKYVDTKGALPGLPKRISKGSKVTIETLNVRTGPSKKYRVVGSLPAGSRLAVTGKQKAGFAQTRYAGKMRWVSVAYLAKPRGSVGTPSAPSAPPTSSAAKGRAAVAFARRQLGKPYQFGAEGPSRFDCSGLTLKAWASVGVSLPRVARQQYAQGRKIAKSQLRAGDLVFFYSQRPSHVGIYVGNGTMIDAPRPGLRVRYASISRMPYAGAVRPG